MKEGRCDLLQPGVKAPGTPKMATLLPFTSSARFTLDGLSSPVLSSDMTMSLGILYPTATSDMVLVSADRDDVVLVVEEEVGRLMEVKETKASEDGVGVAGAAADGVERSAKEVMRNKGAR